MSEGPAVSIITPCWNARRWLPETHASIAAQEGPAWEWIVADDGSDDGSAEWLEELARRDARVRVLRLPHAGRPAPARNAAMREAAGRFLAFLDVDDLMQPGKLARQVAFHEALPPDALSFHAVETFADSGLAQGELPAVWQAPRGARTSFEELLVHGNCAPTSSWMIARETALALGPMDESPACRGLEDYDWLLRHAARGGALMRMPGLWGRYRLHPSSLFTSGNRSVPARLASLARIEAMLETNGHLRGEAGRAARSALRVQQAELLLEADAAGWRRAFREAFLAQPENPRRWIGLAASVLPRSVFQQTYGWLRGRALAAEGRRAASPLGG